MLKLLPLLPGWGTAVRQAAHANVLMPLVLSCPPDHRLHPEQSVSTVQCVALREEERVR